jgi:hypothetical protein
MKLFSCMCVLSSSICLIYVLCITCRITHSKEVSDVDCMKMTFISEFVMCEFFNLHVDTFVNQFLIVCVVGLICKHFVWKSVCKENYFTTFLIELHKRIGQHT